MSFLRREHTPPTIYQLLPQSDHELNQRGWVENPFFLRMEPAGREMYRSIITVDDESVTMYLSCPAGKERTLGAAVRGALPRVALIECPEDPLSGWIEMDKAVAVEFKAGDFLAPFNSDTELQELRSVIEAFGPGRRDGVKGFFEVGFTPDPRLRRKMMAGLTKKISDLRGEIPQGNALQETWRALGGDQVLGGSGKTRYPRPTASSGNRKTAIAFEERFMDASRGVFRVYVRIVVQASDIRRASATARAVASAIQSIGGQNRLDWNNGNMGLVQRAVEGRRGMLDATFPMTARELAQLIAPLGLESERVWQFLVKAPARTSAAPAWLMGGDLE